MQDDDNIFGTILCQVALTWPLKYIWNSSLEFKTQFWQHTVFPVGTGRSHSFHWPFPIMIYILDFLIILDVQYFYFYICVSVWI